MTYISLPYLVHIWMKELQVTGYCQSGREY